MRFWNPLPAGELVNLLRELRLPKGARVLDYGCGNGEVSVELARWHGAHITGVDPNPEAIARCREKLYGEFFAEPFDPKRFGERSFDVIVNIGASPGMHRLLEEIEPLLRAGGCALIGDVHWRRTPSAGYLAFLGELGAGMATFDDHCQALGHRGFVIERTLLASDADWDRYEGDYDANMVAYLASHPDDPDHAQFEARRRAWRAMYLAEGRGTLGFCLYQGRLAEPA